MLKHFTMMQELTRSYDDCERGSGFTVDTTFKGRCLSAREKTPCERGENGYVEDVVKICRPKTDLEKFKEIIDSYTCDELSVLYFRNKEIKKNAISTLARNNEIPQIMILKGCKL